jgi:hypothetical protein
LNQEEVLHLFRVKVLVRAQASLLGDEPTDIERGEFLRKVIATAPRRQGGRPRVIWHIGNVEPIGSDALYFRIGKTTKAIESRFDSETNRFVDAEHDIAPYTHAILHVPYQVCGITPNPKLSPGYRGLARQLAALLSASSVVRNQNVDIEVAEISDPQDIVQIVDESFRVESFTFEFGRPNPFDINKDFHEPLEKFAAAAHATRGKTTVSTHDDLDRRIVSEVARSAAAAGNDLSVKVRANPESKLITKHLHGNPAQITANVDTEAGRREAIARLIEEYVYVRRGPGGG